MSKDSWFVKPYLNSVRNFDVRKCLTKFRLSSHSLQIETGRHVNPKVPVEKRICKMCQSGLIEDEQHFLLHCTFYTNERIIFLSKVLLLDPSLLDGDSVVVFKNILSSNNHDICFVLGRFIQLCFNKRKYVINNHS